jgi:putative glutamine amidotransferase
MSELAPITLDEVMPGYAAEAGHAPRICVVVPLNYPGFTHETRNLVVRFTRSALQTLTDLGAALQVIDVSAEHQPVLDRDVDGVMLLGGGDIDPALYGHHGDVPSLDGVDRGCDERSLEVIAAALASQTPVLGICRGSQLLNVAYGGTLVPDLGPDTPHHGHGGDPLFVDDTVHVEPGTRLAAVLGKPTLTVRNGHHQAVDEVAAELQVAARGVDGVVEAVEHRDPARWVLGVQWHPEDTDGPAADGLALFQAFLAEATLVAGQRIP